MGDSVDPAAAPRDRLNAPRYAPVRYRPSGSGRGRRVLFKAAVEDRRDGMVVPVTNPSLAVALAELLNREERGESLPTSPSTKPIASFRAVSLDTGVGPPFFVAWSNSFARRFVALTYERADAERFAELLNRADYPVHVSPWKVIWQMSWPSVARDDKDIARLEEPTLPPGQIKRHRQ